jgi:MerR family transcriptional regulator/heat shock protein HspR
VSEPGDIHDKLNDQNFPAYTMGLAAELLGVQPAFLRGLDIAGLLSQSSQDSAMTELPRTVLTAQR